MSAADANPYLALLPALRPEWARMVRGYLIGTTSALSLAALTVLAAWTVGHAVVDRALPGPGWWMLLGGLVLVRTVLTWAEMDVSHSLAYRVLARLRMRLFDSYSRSVPGRRREHSGRAASVAMDDIEKLEFFYAHTLAQVATSATVFAASALATAVLLPAAGIVVVFGGAVLASSTLWWARSARRLGEAEHRERAAMSAGIVDALGGLREVLSLGLLDRVVAAATTATARTAVLSRRRALVAELVTSARELTLTAVVIAVLAVTALATTGTAGPVIGDLPAAHLPALIATATVAASAVTDATTTMTQLHPLTASAHRVSDGIHRPPVTRPTEAVSQVPDGPLGLRLSGVSFGYGDRRRVLDGVDLDIAPGEHVGLAGPSGSGKSTIIALGARLWDPDGGAVLLRSAGGSGVPLTEVSDADLRDAVAVVDQESTLFHGSVRENLLRGTARRPDARLEAVLEQVGAAGWIGLDDDLGQGGLRLSGGQQARLCLARALVREPRILLVDEVTASLDPATEREISALLADFPGTLVVASHRKETLGGLDRVITIGTPGP